MERLLRLLAPLSAAVAERLKLAERLSTGRFALSPKMIALYGEDPDMRRTKRFAADIVSAFMIGLVFALLGTAATGGDLYTFLAMVAAVCAIPFVMFQRLDRRIALRKRKLVMELPTLLSKITLLVNAGETVQGAISRCAEACSTASNEPLEAELAKLANRLRNNEPFAHALEIWSKRCAVAEISAFTTTVLMNYRRGGELFVLSLRSLNRELWERRKAMTRILGEEASAKLILPMLLILLAVMAVVAAPAVMLMD
jgi:tight adherence protein C